MDLSLRLILSLVGVLIVVSILLDGLRRIRHNERSRKRKEEREVALKTYVAPTVREKPETDEIVGPVRVMPTGNPTRVVATPKKEPHISAGASRNVIQEELDDEDDSQHHSDHDAQESAEQIFVVNVVAKTREGFAGSEMVPAFLAAGLRFGDMSIFHRYEQTNGQGRVLFSVASLFEPGTFDLDNVDNFYAPGLVFFMRLPGAPNSLAAYNMMIQTAKRIAETLGGELRDRSKNLLTAQTVSDSQKKIKNWMRQHYQVGAATVSE